MSDVLRDLADLLDQKEAGVQQQSASDMFLDPVAQGAKHAGLPDGDDVSDVGKFVPPLQAKIELLKRSTGMDNAIDKTDQDGDPDNMDELDQIKKLANIQLQRAARIDQLADDDGPFEG